MAACRDRALRRAAPGAVLDEEPVAQALHGQQQRERHPQPAGGARRGRARRAHRPPGHDGRLRVRDRGREDPRGLPPGQDRHRRGHRDRAGDPLPGQPRQRLPHDQDAGPADVRLLQQERRRAHHRPAPGDRLGDADGRDAARRAADQPLRLRRRLRNGAQPLPHAGGDRLPADGARHRRPDARVHPHPGHGALHPAGDREPARGRRPRPRLQPDDRVPSGHRSRQAGLEPHRRRDRPRREPAQRGTGERPVRREPPAAGPWARADPPAGRPADGGDGDRARLRPPLRPLADPVQLQVDPAPRLARGAGLAAARGRTAALAARGRGAALAARGLVATPDARGRVASPGARVRVASLAARGRASAPIRPILLNGRAAARATITGVERYSREVVSRLIASAPERYALAVPPAPAVRRPLLGHAWEQLVLPARAAALSAPLVYSPANMAPVMWPGNVVVVHDAAALRREAGHSAPYRAWHSTVGLHAARHALAVVTVSAFSRRELVELGGIDPERIVVIPPGVDARFCPSADHHTPGQPSPVARDDGASGAAGYGPGPAGYGPGPAGYGPGPAGYGPGPAGYGPGPAGCGPAAPGRRSGRAPDGPGAPAASPYVLTVATAEARKNLRALGAVAAALAPFGVQVVWAGESRPQLGSAPAPPGVRALGWVADAALPDLYRGALAYVLPSVHEGFGLTCIEAMACGVPVVAADRAALPETCAGAALLVDPDSPRALTEAVLAATLDERVRARLREAGLRRAAQLSWTATATATHELLARLAENPGHGRG